MQQSAFRDGSLSGWVKSQLMRIAPVRQFQERRQAKHAEAEFKKYYFAEQPVDFNKVTEFRNDAFPHSGPDNWLDRPDALFEIERRQKAGTITAVQAELCEKWVFDGYVILPGLIPRAELDAAWRAYEKAIENGVIAPNCEKPLGPGDNLPGRFLDPHLKIPEIRALLHHRKVLEVTDLLLGHQTLPFQTIMGHKGSSQLAHSDTIHMTTYPLGYLIANWIAFEDIDPDSGPLEYYPRSHRLVPPLLSAELSMAPGQWRTEGGAVYAERYEPQIQRYIAKAGLKPSYFLAKAGDVLFWHANLLHGGSPRKNLALSRKALVCHHFAKGAVTYHDLSGGPTRLHSEGMYAPATVD